MKYATINADGRATGFCDDAVSEPPAGAIPLTDEQYADWLGHEHTRRWDGEALVVTDPPPAGIPASVSARQARLALLAAGRLDDVGAHLSDPAHRASQIEWEYATVIERTSPLVSTIGGALGWTDAEIDALFSDAAGR